MYPPTYTPAYCCHGPPSCILQRAYLNINEHPWLGSTNDGLTGAGRGHAIAHRCHMHRQAARLWVM